MLVNLALARYREGWGPEKVDSYELGAKASFAADSLRGYFNVAGFYNDLTNQQLNVSGVSTVAGFAGAQATVNAGKSRIKGIEVDASATLFDSLKFDLGYTYLDTRLISFTAPAIPAGAPYSVLLPLAAVGGPLAYSPKNRLSLTVAYTLPLPESIGRISASATFVHTDRQFVTQNTVPAYRFLPKTDILNLNLNWNEAFGKPVDLALFVTNVTNRIYPVSVDNAYASSGFEALLYAPPRMFGFRLRYSFSD